ncbi:hypothetical protein IFR04_005567 [Cadophora malorum]|uniref:Uncharacterized protein n=1 Tax=Cadophora malorum TaxID=108018 RepID=A0A8H7TL77_9HELO|nr:hypothetical protein IFR04_005567 [Cadophora malorum]
MAGNTYSSTAINGSANEFAPSPTSPPPRTPAQVAADTALARGRTTTWVTDSSLPVVALSSYHPAYRTQAAGTAIASFEVAFGSGNNTGNNHNDGGNGNGTNN